MRDGTFSRALRDPSRVIRRPDGCVDYCAVLPLTSALGELTVPGRRPPDIANASTPMITTSPPIGTR
jgi:hypothetical protein